MIALLILGLLIAIVFGKGGIALMKGLLLLAFGSLFLMASCAII